MRLPDPLYRLTRDTFVHHAPWHFARMRAEWLEPAERAAWQRARAAFPAVRYVDQPGAGEEFLRFHREMIRVFIWLIVATPEAGMEYRPWIQLPGWLVQAFAKTGGGPQFLSGALAGVEGLIMTGTADQLGSFIEPTDVARLRFDGIHNATHDVVAQVEATTVEPDLVAGAGMGATSTAPNNAHFWALHGWIDERFADWQRRHGEAVDQTPLDPSAQLHGMSAVVPAPLIGNDTAVIDRALSRWREESILRRPLT